MILNAEKEAMNYLENANFSDNEVIKVKLLVRYNNFKPILLDKILYIFDKKIFIKFSLLLYC